MRSLIARIRHSLAARLLLISIASLFAVLLVISVFFATGWGHKFDEVLLPHLQRYHAYLLQELGNPPTREKAAALASQLPLQILLFDEQGSWSSDGQAVARETLEKPRRPRNSELYRDDHSERFYLHHRSGDTEVFIGISKFPERGHGGPLLLLIALILAVSYWLIKRLFQPLKPIRAGVAEFSEGNFSHRIPEARKDELGELAGQVNHMADAIDAMLKAKRDLLLAISHELRSPLTRSKVALELIEQNDITDGIRRDLNDMEQLLSEILESERLKNAHAHSVLQRSEFSLEELLRDVTGKLDPDGKRIRLDAEDCICLLDRPRIKLLLHNLLGNALRHNRDEIGPVGLHARCHDGQLVIDISDHGEGIATEHLLHLTEPFYRVDPSRQRKTGGYGLGLHLCQVIAEAHGGGLRIESVLGKGTTVHVRCSLG
ncbi:MAG: HAMP domain-containing histidine kinase [Gammaproteobacteria bacterium]|nr:HAMP domain-containing histidine kinase [Gammaproteobacteria bacterium]